VAVNGGFDVTLIVIHTDPDEATEEINALDVVVNYTQNKYPDEQDFIVMGDLNADCSVLSVAAIIIGVLITVLTRLPAQQIAHMTAL
jgi:hypothetical protein